MPKLKGKSPVLTPNSLSILLIYKPSNFLGPLQTMRQGYFSKEKRFNTFFINLIYNKGGEEPIKTEPVKQHLQKENITSSSRAN